jgi:hypothetical protein
LCAAASHGAPFITELDLVVFTGAIFITVDFLSAGMIGIRQVPQSLAGRYFVDLLVFAIAYFVGNSPTLFSNVNRLLQNKTFFTPKIGRMYLII